MRRDKHSVHIRVLAQSIIILSFLVSLGLSLGSRSPEQ